MKKMLGIPLALGLLVGGITSVSAQTSTINVAGSYDPNLVLAATITPATSSNIAAERDKWVNQIIRIENTGDVTFLPEMNFYNATGLSESILSSTSPTHILEDDDFKIVVSQPRNDFGGIAKNKTMEVNAEYPGLIGYLNELHSLDHSELTTGVYYNPDNAYASELSNTNFDLTTNTGDITTGEFYEFAVNIGAGPKFYETIENFSFDVDITLHQK